MGLINAAAAAAARVFVRASEVKSTSNSPCFKRAPEVSSIQGRAQVAGRCQAMCETPRDQDRFHFCMPYNISGLQIINIPPGSQGGIELEDNMKMMQVPSSHGLYTGVYKTSG